MSQAITKSFVKKHEKEIKSLLNEIEEDRNCKGKILVIVSEEVIKKIGEIYFCQNKFSRPIFMYTPPSSLEITLTRKQEKIVKPFIKNLLKHEIQNSQFGFNNKPDMVTWRNREILYVHMEKGFCYDVADSATDRGVCLYWNLVRRRSSRRLE